MKVEETYSRKEIIFKNIKTTELDICLNKLGLLTILQTKTQDNELLKRASERLSDSITLLSYHQKELQELDDLEKESKESTMHQVERENAKKKLGLE